MRPFRRRDDPDSQDEARLLAEMWSPERVARLMSHDSPRPRDNRWKVRVPLSSLMKRFERKGLR